jgi:hypothetical protein
MKYAIRRALVGIVSIPFVAGAYTFVYLALIALGADPSASLGEVFANGVNIAIVIAIILTFFPQFTRLVDKFL